MVFQPVKSDLYRPTTLQTVISKTVNDDQAQKYVDEFLQSCDKLVSSSALSGAVGGETGSNPSVYTGPRATKISQLKRLQRELRGLPPLMLEEQQTEAPKANKKIVFGDEPAEEAEKPKPKKTVFGDEEPAKEDAKEESMEDESSDSSDSSDSEPASKKRKE